MQKFDENDNNRATKLAKSRAGTVIGIAEDKVKAF